MYNQRRYGGSTNVKPSNQERGNLESRHSKSSPHHVGTKNKGKTSVTSRSGPLTPQSKQQEQPKNDIDIKKNAVSVKSELASDSSQASIEAGHQFVEDTYIESDIIGFDGSADQPAEEQPIQIEKYNQQVMDNSKQTQHQRGSQEQRFQPRTPQKPNSQSRGQMQEKRGSQSEGSAQKTVRKDELIEDTFGIVRMGNKRLVNIDSLILPHEKKHGGRSRLFVGNLTNGVTEDDLKELFGRFGDASEIYVNKEKGFGFVRLDYKVNAEIARNTLDGYLYKGRPMKVKFAANQSAIEIHGIDRFTSNESLEAAFSMFGTVERATVVCDERGRSKGYAVIEFAFKKSAQTALQRINNGLFVLGRLPKPVTAKPLSQTDEEGIHEKDLERIPGLAKDREYKARFLQPETPEFAMARKWRQLEEEGQNQKATLEKQLEEDQHKMEFDFEAALRDQESEYIRQELLQKQAAIEEEIRRYDEMRNRESMMLRQQGPNFDNMPPNRRQGDDRDMQYRGMPNAGPNMGLGNLGPAAALALAANSNILQAIKGQDPMAGGGPGMQRMGGPRGGPMGVPPRGPGMMGVGGMPPRPLFDGRQGPPRGNSMSGTRRPASRENSNNNKRPRK